MPPLAGWSTIGSHQDDLMSSFGRVSGQAPARLPVLFLLAAELPAGLHIDSNWLSLAGDVPVTV